MKTMFNILIVTCLLIPAGIFGNTRYFLPVDETDEPADSVYHQADEMPAPLGGMQGLANNIVYPADAKKAGIEGKVLVSATVNEKGKVIKVEVKKGVDKLLDAAAIEAVKKTMFSPAKVGGKTVKSEVVIPINFSLGEKAVIKADESHPFPVGGMEALMKNLVYPEEVKEMNLEGKVFVQAQIDADGNVTETKILKSLHPKCDEASMNAVKAVRFTPAKKDGKAVSSEVVIPFMFKLQ